MSELRVKKPRSAVDAGRGGVYSERIRKFKMEIPD